MHPTTIFCAQLIAAGIPVEGISGPGPDCRIDFLPAATSDQMIQARHMAQHFDWKANFYGPLRQEAFEEIAITDQLDALWKLAERFITPDADAPPDSPEGCLARIQAIKDKYPKPRR
jgi:hypothetical protein